MTFLSKRKRKNDDPPRFPAWIVVLVAIGMVMIVALFSQLTSRSTVDLSVQNVLPSPDDPILITATYIIQRATAMAQGTPQPGVVVDSSNLDPYAVTATYIVQQETAVAQGTPRESINLDPIEITATYIVKQATQQASTSGS